MNKLLRISLAVSICFSLSGCKPAQEEGKEERADSVAVQPQHFKKNSGVPENFNRDIHVIGELLDALDNPSIAKERKELLLGALEMKATELDILKIDLTQEEQLVLEKARTSLGLDFSNKQK